MLPMAPPAAKIRATSQNEVSAEPTVSVLISPVEVGPEQVSAQLIAGQEQANPGQAGQDGQRVAQIVRP